MNSSPSIVVFRRTTRDLAHRLISRAARLVAPKKVAVVAPSPSGPSPDELSGPLGERLSWLCGALPYFSEALKYDRELLDSWGGGPDACLPSECYREKDVLDLGCGIGAASALLVARGARLVWGIDPTLTDEHLAALATLPNARFSRSVLREDLFEGQRFDLVYARFVSEHVRDLASLFRMIHTLLRPGGRIVGLHTNYYGPMGGHDHAFIWPLPGEDRQVTSKAPRCWESLHKCAVSAQFRAECENRHDWTVGQWRLTPEDCGRCLYFHRAQLWSHLLFQDDFVRDFPGERYRCDADGGLNKVTPFQLRQYLLEADFGIKNWILDPVENEPPAELLEKFPFADLTTGNILFAAVKQ